MRHLRVATLALASVLLSSSLAQALVRIDINLNDQSMHVTAADGEDYVWPISSGRRGFPTPTGNYRPQYMTPLAISYKYHNTPMPHSIFFRGGYAIHATAAVGSLGRPASHGCVRLAPENAARLYQLVQAEGAAIHILGNADAGMMLASEPRHLKRHMAALAYAPRHHGRSLKQWMLDPVGVQ